MRWGGGERRRVDEHGDGAGRGGAGVRGGGRVQTGDEVEEVDWGF